MTTKKIFAVSVVAVLCLSGYLAVIQDDSSAEVDYVVHLELYKDGDKFSVWKALKEDKYDEPSLESFKSVVHSVVRGEDSYGMVTFISDEVILLKCNTTYKRSGTLLTDDCYGFINWYLDGLEWKQIVDDNYSYKKVGVTYSRIYTEDQYNKLSDDQKKDYVQVEFEGLPAYAHKVSEHMPKEVKNFLFIGLGVIVLVILLLVALMIHSRRKSHTS